MAAPSVVASPTPPDEGSLTPYRRRRWPRRLLIGLNVFLAVCLLAIGSLYGYVTFRLGQIHRISIGGLTIGAAPGVTSGGGGPPMNILVVGSDSRAALSSADDNEFGSGADVGGQRSDTIMIVHLNPGAGTASLLSIPRDLWVPIPGQGSNRINSAFDTSADLLVRTIQDNLGIPINHFIEVDFDTFRQVVNALGGVKFWYPEPVRDNDNGVNDSGLNITAAGCYTLTGDMALSLVRTRHLQYYSDGEWHFEGESDLARIRRQQLFVKKVIAKAESTGLANVTALNGVVGGVVSNLTVDSGFSQHLMLALARRYRNFNPSSLPTSTLPTYAATIDGADVLLLDKTQSQGAIDAWEGVAPSTSTSSTTPGSSSVSPSSVTVGVLNGSGVEHQASSAVDSLRSIGFNASISGTGSASSFSYATPVIEYAPGDQARAQLLQGDIIGGATLQTDSNLSPGTVLLITGASYGGIQASSSTATSSPATTPVTTAAAAQPVEPVWPGPQGQDPPPPGSGC
jgi:LCP family protein required for cell wall assembly